MPALIVLSLFALVVLLIVQAGLAAERHPRVAEIQRRLAPITHPQRARFGVDIFRDKRVPALVRLLPITAFVYWVTPVDLIPDFIPGIGYFDDRIVLALSLRITLALSPRGLLEEHLRRAEWLAQEQRDAERQPGLYRGGDRPPQ